MSKQKNLIEASQNVTFDTGGNVGIGTTPSVKFHVKDTFSALSFEHSGGNAVLKIDGGNGDLSGTDYSSIVDTGGTLLFGTNGGTERMRIDNSGRVTTPFQPAFHAYDGQSVQSGDVIVTYTNLLFNEGGHYNSGNGRFTAPVAGTYMFTCYIQPHTTTYSTYSSIAFRKNGSVYGTSELVMTWAGGSDHEIVGGTALMKMSAGDYCDVQATRGYRGIQGHFCGHLVG